jgi:hypothetical protein
MLHLVLFASLTLGTHASLLSDDVPLAGGGADAAPTAASALSKSTGTTAAWGWQFAAGTAVGILAVPGSLYLAEAFGSLSNNLIGAAIPALLCMGLIPPLLITLATVLVGNWTAPGTYKFWPAFLANLVINGASLAIGAALGLTVGVFGKVLLYTLVQAVLQSGVSTGLERLWPNEKPTVIANHDAIAPTTFVAPAGTVSF